jgi:hypothetical protein
MTLSEVVDSVQTLALVILVFVTAFYAKRIHDLARSAEEQTAATRQMAEAGLTSDNCLMERQRERRSEPNTHPLSQRRERTGYEPHLVMTAMAGGTRRLPGFR